jgi:Rrf2 family cysteine metabolism transcriptional repressor
LTRAPRYSIIPIGLVGLLGFPGKAALKLTARSEYALLALVHLARQEARDHLAVRQIAEVQEIPEKFLEQILLTLKRARYLQSHKGQNGGYRLAKPAREISLAEIIRLFDGPLAPTESASRHFYGPTPIERAPRVLRVFKGIRDHISSVLEKTTLADVI